MSGEGDALKGAEGQFESEHDWSGPGPDKTPYLDDGDFRLFNGEALEVLKGLPAESVHCVVTSPPYWGLRDYGTASWEGGNPDCDHLGEPFRTKAKLNENWGAGFSDVKNAKDRQPFKEVCGKCGARRVDQALGLEATPELYVARMVEVFREVRRVLRGDGVCWVNLGDSYAAQRGGTAMGAQTVAQGNVQDKPQGFNHHRDAAAVGLKHKDLVGIPWRVAFALQADGWYLRSDVVWSKPNPMPESVTDRPTKAHEYVFLLTKSPRYFFDQEAVREQQPTADPSHPGYRPAVVNGRSSPNRGGGQKYDEAGFGTNPGNERKALNPSGRNVRSVWEIATQPYPEAHFATYPEELVRRCILAGTSERGCCPECGAPWEREIEVERRLTRPGTKQKGAPDRNDGGIPFRPETTTKTLGWHPSCNHVGAEEDGKCIVPCTVLDPFGGSGTTALVARKYGRRSILIELSGPYCELAARRLSQLSLLSGAV